MSAKRHLTTVALVLVAVATGVWAWLDRGSVTDVERELRPEMVFPAFRKDDLSRIELVKPDETLVLTRVRSGGPDSGGEEDSWRLESPIADRAETGPVYNLLGAIEFATEVRKLKESTAPGLDRPRVRGTISMGAVTYRFALGDDAPVPAGAAYLRLEGEGIFVVKKELVDALLAPASKYRQRNFVPYLSIELSGLVVKSKAGELAIARVDDLDFKMVDSGLRASRNDLDKVWGAFGLMRAEAWLSDEEGAAATADPQITVMMQPIDAKKPRGEVAVGGACPGYPDDVAVVRRAPAPVEYACAPKGIVEGLSTPPASLADERLFSAREDEIAELVLQVSPSGERLEIARTEKGWHERAPIDRALEGEEADAANVLAQQIAHAQGTGVRKKKDDERIVPRLRATVTRAQDRGVEVVEIDPHGVAHRLADDALLSVSPDVARWLEPRATALRGRTIWKPALEDRPIQSLGTTCAAVPQELARGEQGWELRAPKGYAADASGAFDLAQAMERVRTEMWIADEDDGTFGLTGPGACKVTLTVEQDGGARTVALTLGGKSRHGEALVYARADGDAGVFVVPRSVRELASELLVDRTGFHLDPDAWEKVTLTRGGKDAIALVPSERRWMLEGAEMSAGLRRAADLLPLLRAEHVVHLGKPAEAEGFAHPTLEIAARGPDGGAALRAVVGKRADNMYFARIDGVDASFALAASDVDDLLRAWEK